MFGCESCDAIEEGDPLKNQATVWCPLIFCFGSGSVCGVAVLMGGDKRREQFQKKHVLNVVWSLSECSFVFPFLLLSNFKPMTRMREEIRCF